jgi:hypothetical protein
VLPQNTERILAMLDDDDRVLDVGGWAAPFNRADVILDYMPYETRGALVPGGFGPGPERFDADSWVRRDICDREPWPFEDDEFDFSLCVTTLEDIRDPIWVCSELARVSKAGYIEVPTIEAELIYGIQGTWLGHEHHRWLCTIEGDTIEFMHKPHSIHSDWRVRVVPRWHAKMTDDEHLQGMFWEGDFSARERVVIGDYPLDELEGRIRDRFQPSALELRLKEGRDRLRHAVAVGRRPLRTAVERALGAWR